MSCSTVVTLRPASLTGQCVRYKHYPCCRYVLDCEGIHQTPRRRYLLHCPGFLLDEHRVVAWCSLRLPSDTATHLVSLQSTATHNQEFVIWLRIFKAHRKQTPKQFWRDLWRLAQALQGDRRVGAYAVRRGGFLRISGEWTSIHICRARDKKRCDDPSDLRLKVLGGRNDKLACKQRYVSITAWSDGYPAYSAGPAVLLPAIWKTIGRKASILVDITWCGGEMATLGRSRSAYPCVFYPSLRFPSAKSCTRGAR